jgi:hypothetical protein
MKAFLVDCDRRESLKILELKLIINEYVGGCPKWPTNQIRSLLGVIKQNGYYKCFLKDFVKKC